MFGMSISKNDNFSERLNYYFFSAFLIAKKAPYPIAHRTTPPKKRKVFKVLPVILSMLRTKATSKFQATIPLEVRNFLDVKPGAEIEWCIVKGMVIVDTARKMEHPVKFLTSQIKLDMDAVKLVRESREEFR